MQIHLDINSVDDYNTFLRIKSLPSYRFTGRTAYVPDEYAHLLIDCPRQTSLPGYDPLPSLWDYQRALSQVAISKKKYAVFADCGLGKSLIIFEYARYVSNLISPSRRVLIVTPLMVTIQMINEVTKFYKNAGYQDFSVEQVRSHRLSEWLTEIGSSVGITNYEAIHDETPKGRLGALILDESSMLKSEYGKHAQNCIRLGQGLDWKLCSTGTPAPNDRTEFANTAVFLDIVPTVNAFYSKYFRNTGKTGERWELKDYAVKSFYKDMSHWAIFLTDPSIYGWKDNCSNIPPINYNIHNVDLTDEQKVVVKSQTGMLFAIHAGGITKRSQMSQIAKGKHKGKKITTNKYTYIRDLVKTWQDESTIIWALYNNEQDELEKVFPNCASIQGKTPYSLRLQLLSDFQAGRRKVLLSKASVLGFGLNLQVATRQVFSSCVDSFEKFYQCIKRSNRYGSTKPLNIHIPVSDIEVEMMENVLNKSKRVQEDTRLCEEMFRDYYRDGFGGSMSDAG
jgi:SNF2-related domain